MKTQTWQQWVRAVAKDPESPSNIEPGLFGALTGQDIRTLNAISACCSDEDGQRGALEAIRALLPAMQSQTRWWARELIPFAMEWSDRAKLWPLVSEGA